MAGEDVLGGNAWEPYGYTNQAWGGQGVDPGIQYTGGYTKDPNSQIPNISDPAAWQRYQDAQHASTGQYQAVNRYQNMGAAAALRYAPDIDYSGAQRFSNSAVDAQGMGNDVRGDQQQSLGLARAAAMGQAPSQAEALGRNLIGQSLQGQLAGAASARGGSMGQAAAMRQAQMGAASFQQQGMNSLAGMRAQEMANARDQYGAQAAGIRGQDYQLAGQNIQQSAQAAQQSQIQAQLDQQQQQMNQQDQQYYEGLGWNTNNAMLNAGMGQSAQAQQNMQFQQQMAMQQDQQQQQMLAAEIGGVVTLGAGAISRRADGGPVAPGQPVLVGERGPEVIVPAQQPMDRGTNAIQNGMTLGQVAAAIGSIAPGAGILYSGAGLGAQAQGYMTRAQDDAARAAQAQQKAQDDERAAMQAAERAQALAAPAHGIASTQLAPEAPRQQSRAAALLDWALGRDRGIPARAGGGPMPPNQPVLVGEQGPEVVQMQQPGVVLPATHPVSQQVARKQMTMGDVARLRQQADELQRDLERRQAQGPSVHAQPDPYDAWLNQHARPQAAPTMATAAMMGGRGDPYATPAAPPPRLMGGREDPYASYDAVTWGPRMYGGREDPYSQPATAPAPTMATAALQAYR